MTYRIHHSIQRGASVFVLSGVLDTEHAAQLQELLATAADARIVLDLKDITLVDRAAVRFLARVELAGTEIVNCPEYVLDVGGKRQPVIRESVPGTAPGCSPRRGPRGKSRPFRGIAMRVDIRR